MESRTLDFSIPSTPGTFYVGVCIDSVSGESDTDNNCSDGVRVDMRSRCSARLSLQLPVNQLRAAGVSPWNHGWENRLRPLANCRAAATRLPT